MNRNLIIILTVIVVMQACDSNKQTVSENRQDRSSESKAENPDHYKFRLSYKPDVRKIPAGSDMLFFIKNDDPPISPDSIVLRHNGKRTGRFIHKDSLAYRLPEENPGNHHFQAVAYAKGKSIGQTTAHIELVSDIVPASLKYKLIHTYPHDTRAFTQGLTWEDGYLYEGTGQYGRSSIRKIDLKEQKTVLSLSLADNIFGEGICIYRDKLIQLSWRSSKGFVYNKSNFRLIKEFNYFTEGWGITTDGQHLIMSDGTHMLYYLDPEYFTQVKQLPVYDNRGKVDLVNELEYVNGSIYANVYQQNHIIEIDPETGKVLARVDLSALVPDNLKYNKDKVLNGIAYHRENNTLMVTGKMWPRLFEISLEKP